MSSPVPIVVCGKVEAIGRVVIESLKPEYEVIHFIKAGPSGPSLLPALVAGLEPPSHPDSSAIGTGNYSQPPRAIVLGGAFDDEVTERMRKAVEEKNESSRRVPWLMQDMNQNMPQVGTPAYAHAVVDRVKVALAKLEGDGKLNGNYGEVEWY